MNETDSINRQAAIDEMRKCRFVVDAIEKISKLPPTGSERESAEWVKNDNGTYSCSRCQSWIPKEQRYYARFCLHCGSKMEGRNR